MNPGLQPSEWPPLSGATVGEPHHRDAFAQEPKTGGAMYISRKAGVHVSRPGAGQAAEDSLRRKAEDVPWLTVHRSRAFHRFVWESGSSTSPKNTMGGCLASFRRFGDTDPKLSRWLEKAI